MSYQIKKMPWGHMILHGPFFLILIYFFVHGDAQAQLECQATEHQILLNFMEAIPKSGRSFNWSGDGNCCAWQGITCSVYPQESSKLEFIPTVQQNKSLSSQVVHVNRLSLPDLGLKANLPSYLGQLIYLEYLNLSGNHFNGAIPMEFKNLSRLKVLDLSSNNLSDGLAVFDSMISLQFINISSNIFSGELPSYGNLSNLGQFYARQNHLQGPFNTIICQYSPKLSAIDFSSNHFYGTLEEGLSRCGQLSKLLLSSNTLAGFLPRDIFNLSSLAILGLDSNNFEGELGDGMGNLQNLTDLNLCYNNFTGSLPKVLSQNSKITTLLLCNNKFTGPVDVNFSNLTFLDTLNLNSNFLSGPLPDSLANCSRLYDLSLSKNAFTGEIPAGFNSLKSLTTATLSTNRLTGSLLSLSSCENLVSLILTKNIFQESLPAAIDGFKNLQVLALGYLNLSGHVPVWLQNCTKLQILDLSWNNFHGEIPQWLGTLPHLMYLELSNNSFSGFIPLQIVSLPSMMHNDTNTSGLQELDNPLVVKRQSGSFGLMYSKAMALPPSLYLADNQLIGPIPEKIGQLRVLVSLDLSKNLLSGSIPASLANAEALETLDLSSNTLTGPIPTSLTNLTFLATFNVSYNSLSGPIPMRNQFSTFLNTSYVGNLNLCGAPVLQACLSAAAMDSVKSTESPNRAIRGIKIILVSISAAVMVVLLLMGGLYWVLSRRNAVHQGLESSRDMNVPENLSDACSISVELFQNNQKLTVGDLLRATNNFDAANIVGCGGFGLVYRADLGDGSRLAIKKLTGDCGQMEREFRAEVDALSKAQHRNLVSLQGYLHIGNEKLLIYSYMENGSLDYWLHERSDGGVRLDWPTRLKIAQGAAAGLAYLHQICNPHIVHRDIKSSNILLDEQFEAHLADFGLARLLMAQDTHVTTELVGTLGYIPPEYGEALNATTRGDVYSFGVVLLELLTGKRPVDVCKPKGCGDLVAWVHEMRKDLKPDHIYDTGMRSKSYDEQMRQLLDVACSCINRNPLKRPIIRDVVNQLNQIGQVKHSID